MPFLMHIAFDNNCRLEKDEYLFEYNGVPFKLIQNDPRRHSDVLITIIPVNRPDKEEEVYAAAGEFLSALSWQNRSQILLGYAGGMAAQNLGNLKDATCRFLNLPRVAVIGNNIGHKIDRLPKIETPEQRTALALMREARSSNVAHLSFLFFWHVMEVDGRNAEDVVDALNGDQPGRFRRLPVYMDELELNGRTLGRYLLEDCRHAIAHIRRNPGRQEISIDSLKDVRRIGLARGLVEDFAEAYIQTQLGFGEPEWLVRVKNKEFPIYVDDAYIRQHYGDLIND